jgi:hypothetical protein
MKRNPSLRQRSVRRRRSRRRRRMRKRRKNRFCEGDIIHSYGRSVAVI